MKVSQIVISSHRSTRKLQVHGQHLQYLIETPSSERAGAVLIVNQQQYGLIFCTSPSVISCQNPCPAIFLSDMSFAAWCQRCRRMHKPILTLTFRAFQQTILLGGSMEPFPFMLAVPTLSVPRQMMGHWCISTLRLSQDLTRASSSRAHRRTASP